MDRGSSRTRLVGWRLLVIVATVFAFSLLRDAYPWPVAAAGALAGMSVAVLLIERLGNRGRR